MKIGVPKELKCNETRVSLVPSGVNILKTHGNEIYIQKDAGLLSGFTNEEYEEAGANIVDSINDIYKKSEIIVKVKEPEPCEYELLQKEQILFTFLHLVVEKELTKVLLKKRINAIACEHISTSDGQLPVLMPMSEVAGKASILIGSNLLQKHKMGEGVLLSSIPGIQSAKVVIIGAGTVGVNALKAAVGLGTDVTILDTNIDKLRYVNNLGLCVNTVYSNEYNIQKVLKNCDLLICAVLTDGRKSPIIVKENMVKSMKKGSVIIDVSIDQGTIVETIDRVTTLENPTFIKHGVVHYAVENIPGAYPRTSTVALTNATIKYIMKISDIGFVDAVKVYPELQPAVVSCYGKLTNIAVAQTFGMDFYELSSIIGF